MATTTKKATTKAPAKKATSAAKKSTAKRTAAPKKAPALHEREPKVIVEDASYAVAGLASDAIDFAKSVPSKLESLRTQLEKLVEDAPNTAKGLAEDAPNKAKGLAEDVRTRLIAELEKAIATFEKNLDAKAAEGRKLVTEVKKDARVGRILDQSGNTRSQVKAAVTSVTKTVDVAVDAGRKQAGTATSQVKAAVTSLRKTADTVVDAAEKTAQQTG